MSSNEWEKFKLSEIMEIIGGGTPRTNIVEYWNGNIPWLSVVDFGGEKKYVFETEKSITQLGLDNSSAKILKKGQIIISARGTVGELAILGKDMAFNQSCYGLNSKAMTSNDFLYYLLKYNIEQIKRKTHGAVFDTITRETFDHIEINLPPISTQRRIADILSALDDKIELNRQTNATLEAIAQAIFKEWFFDFNFPGATGELVESELGMIPKGWRIGSVAEILILANETVSPGSNPDKLFYHYSIPAFDSGRVPSQELGSAILSNKYKVKSNSILVSKLNPRIPRVWPLKEVNQESSVCSTEFQVLLPQKAHYYSFAANLFSQTSMIDTMKSRASGTSSSHQRIIPQDILDINIIIPNDDLLALFDEIVGNYYHCIINGLEESVILAKIRDSLLPKLMNGEIEV